MDTALLQPFIDATIDTFNTMLAIEPSVREVKDVRPPFDQQQVTALIGLSGDAIGVVAISFSEDVTRKVIGNFIGEDVDEIDEDVYDAVGEIINIVAGAAKAGLGELKVTISLPSVMHGERFRMALPRSAQLTQVSFELPDVGTMEILVSLKPV